MGKKSSGVFHTLLGVVSNVKDTNSPSNSLVGPNEIGKSTILKLIIGELHPSSRDVFRSVKDPQTTEIKGPSQWTCRSNNCSVFSFHSEGEEDKTKAFEAFHQGRLGTGYPY